MLGTWLLSILRSSCLCKISVRWSLWWKVRVMSYLGWKRMTEESELQGCYHMVCCLPNVINKIYWSRKDISHRPQILNRTQSSSLLADEATIVASGPSFSNSSPFTFTPQEHDFNSHHFLGSFSASHASQYFTAGNHEQFYESMNSTGSEQPLSSFPPITGTPGSFSEISSSDNPFGLTLTGHVPNPLCATEIFSEEMQPQFRPSLHLPTIVEMSNLGPFGELAPPGIGSVAGTSPRPWDGQSQEQRVINGGTFIGGNLNYIHTTHTTVMRPSKILISIVWLCFHLAFTGISADQTARKTNNCPLPSRIFHGRQAILDKMHEFFNQDIGKQNIYVLHGLGGAGKTQIGLKFVNNSLQ